MRVDLAISGTFLAGLVGYLIGTLLEHPPGPGGLQFVWTLIGIMVALTVLILGEALKSPTPS